jgi:hypothetical protein
MELRLLGPFEVADGDRTLVIGGGTRAVRLAGKKIELAAQGVRAAAGAGS